MIKANQKFFNGLLVVLDMLVIFLAYLVSWYLRFISGIFPDRGHLSFAEHAEVLVITLPILIIVQYLNDLYSPQRTKQLYKEILNIIKSNFIFLAFVFSLLFLQKEIDISRALIVTFIATNILLTVLERGTVRIFLRTIRSKGFNIKYVLIIGAGDLASKYIKAIERNKQLGYQPIGALDDEKRIGWKVAGVSVIGNVDQLDETLVKHYIDEVVVALPLHAYDKLKKILAVCEKAGVKSLIIPDYIRYMPAKPHFDEIEDIPLINTRYVPLENIGNRIVKRLFDIIAAWMALIVFSPIMIVVSGIIKLTSPGDIIFRQERIGYNRKPFVMYKFRTMKCQANAQSDQTWTTKGDSRKTVIGEFLRKTSLDELPQLFNVIKGDMSIIGPRPERPFFVEQFKEEIPKYMIKHHVRPGLTGWAQVNGWRGDTSIDERIKHDIYYIENWSFMFDLRILWLTLLKGFINRNAY